MVRSREFLRFKGLLLGVGLFFFLGLVGCDQSSLQTDKSLFKAVFSVKKMTSKRFISRTGFMALSSKKPSDYVSYLFSTAGMAEWPPSEGSEKSLEMQQAKSIGDTPLPAGVKIVPYKVETNSGKQIVVMPDDKKWEIVVEAYIDPRNPAVFKKSWAFPKL